VLLLWAIVVSVVLVSLESVASIRAAYGPFLVALEWALTGLFTLEYILRIVCIARPSRYLRSFFGLVDLAALLPSYLALLLPGANSLMVIRTVRLLRVFRILKLVHFSREAGILLRALVVTLCLLLLGPRRGCTGRWMTPPDRTRRSPARSACLAL